MKKAKDGKGIKENFNFRNGRTIPVLVSTLGIIVILVVYGKTRNISLGIFMLAVLVLLLLLLNIFFGEKNQTFPKEERMMQNRFLSSLLGSFLSGGDFEDSFVSAADSSMSDKIKNNIEQALARKKENEEFAIDISINEKDKFGVEIGDLLSNILKSEYITNENLKEYIRCCDNHKIIFNYSKGNLYKAYQLSLYIISIAYLFLYFFEVISHL